jgi:excisionase family DNA binding protein
VRKLAARKNFGLLGRETKLIGGNFMENTATFSETPLLITLEQAAERLAISRRTLERLISAGEFPSPLKLGRASRLAVSDLDAYCAQLRSRRSQNSEVHHG